MSSSTLEDTIPTIDIGPLMDDDRAARRGVVSQIGAACRGTGFFAIRHHPIGSALLDEVFVQSARFFAQPAEAKASVSITRSRNNRGYVALEGESLDPTLLSDVKEAFNIGRDPDPLEPAVPDTPSQGPNLWPSLTGFREPMIAYYAACRRLCERLHAAFALDLGLAEDYFAPLIDRPMATLRLLRYPPHPEPFDGSRYGAGPHTDYGNVTLLAQGEVGGLEVRSRSGRWMRVEPSPGTLICNIGDCLMRWSNDVYVSTPHRVVNLGGKERFSVAFFFDPNADAPVACLPTCAWPGRPARYEPTTGGAYLRSRLDATYAFRRDAS